MAVEIKHAFTCLVDDDPESSAAGAVVPSHWNADHTVTGVVLTVNGEAPDEDGNVVVAGTGTAETYTNATAVPTTLGGIAAGTTFTERTMSQIFEALLYPYQAPAFSSFTFGQASPVEVGTTLSGTKTFTWGTTNSANVAASSLSIIDVTGSATLASSLANDGTESLAIGTVTKSTATSHTWRISGSNTQLGTFFTRDISIAWQWKRFYGESTETSLDETAVEALRVSGLASGFAGTYSFAAGGYKYLAYPSVFGTAATFKDASTNLDIPFETSTTLTVTNTNGVATTYRAHRSTNIMGAAVSIIVA